MLLAWARRLHPLLEKHGGIQATGHVPSLAFETALCAEGAEKNHPSLGPGGVQRVGGSLRQRAAVSGPLGSRTGHCCSTTDGGPKRIHVDGGPEFISNEFHLWAWMNGVTLDFSRPGKPTDNAFAESFNGKFRADCLNVSGS